MTRIMSDPWTHTQAKHRQMAGPRSFLWSLEQRLEDWLLGWNTGKIPDLSGKVALVTGGNSGLGYETCKKLAENCAKVYLLARDRQKAEEAAAKIQSEVGPLCGKIEPLGCDLYHLADVERLVRDFRARGDRLDILIANAGIFHPGPFALTEDGFEQTLQVDYYSQVWLILALMDIVVGSAPSRIVLQSSDAERFGTLDWDNLKGDKFKDSGMTPYGTSKLWLIMFGWELQRRLRAMGGKPALVDVFATHPGLTTTPLMDKADTGRYWSAWLVTLGGAIWGNPTWRGALPTLYAATEPSLQGKGFQMFGPNNMLNLGILTRYKPQNRIWYRGGEAARQRLFDETIRILEQSGHPVPRNAKLLPGDLTQPAGEAGKKEAPEEREPAGPGSAVGAGQGAGGSSTAVTVPVHHVR